jgi:hypothetical protein
VVADDRVACPDTIFCIHPAEADDPAGYAGYYTKDMTLVQVQEPVRYRFLRSLQPHKYHIRHTAIVKKPVTGEAGIF